MEQQSTLRILTNMTFWQSPEWMARVDSIYPDHGKNTPVTGTPWKEAWTLFTRRDQYDIIHTMGIRESMFYGLLCLLCGIRSKQIMTEIFLDEPSSAGPGWSLKTALYRRVSRRAIGIITNSRAEITALADRLALPERRFRPVPLNSTVAPLDAPSPGEGFVLAAGRSLRDYATLIQAAPAIRAPIVIIGGSEDLIGLPLPSGVTLLREIDRKTYLDYVRRCSIMVLPLKAAIRPAGQVVMLEGMAFGKPIVATNQVGTVDYIRDGENGLLIPPGDASALAGAVNEILQHPEKARKLGEAALNSIKTTHTHRVHTELRLDAIEKLARVPPVK